MLGKFILTLLVVIAAALALKQRQTPSPKSTGGKNSTNTSQPILSNQDAIDETTTPSTSSDFRLAAYLFLIMMFGAATILYYFRWQNDHTIITVTLVRDNDSAGASYQVYKYQLDTRSFTTTDGTLITVADSERMEVTGLE